MEVQVNNKLFKKIKNKTRNWIAIEFENIKTDDICFIYGNETVYAKIKKVEECQFITNNRGLFIEFELIDNQCL